MYVSKVYAELDAILDTRLAVVSYLNEIEGEALSKNKLYFKRVNNDLSGLTSLSVEEFEAAYKSRDYDKVSPHWKATGILKQITKDFLVSKGDSANYKEDGLVKLTVNLYPYTIDDTSKDLMMAALKRITKADDIEFVSLMVELVTPNYLRNNCNTAVIYEYDVWINTHYKELGDSPMPSTTMIHPYVMVGETDRPHFMIVDEAQRVFKAVMDLHIHPLGDFSVTEL